MKLSKLHYFIIINVIVLIVGLFFALTLGATNLKITDVWNSIYNFNNSIEHITIRDVRLPRVLAVIFTGGILGLTGAMMQGITRNPIAEPSLLGVSQGATLVIAIFYSLKITVSTINVLFASLIGAIISGVLVVLFLFKSKADKSITRILLAGTSISTFFISLTTIIGLLSNQSQFIAFWVSGGFRNTTWADFLLVMVAGITGLIVAMLLSKKINVLSLGDDVAIGLGENPTKVKLVSMIVIILISAAAVVVGKNIAFVGLIIPEIVRKIFGENYTLNIPLSFLLGAILLTYSDIAARLIYSPYEIPIGIFTALIGVPFFIILARREMG